MCDIQTQKGSFRFLSVLFSRLLELANFWRIFPRRQLTFREESQLTAYAKEGRYYLEIDQGVFNRKSIISIVFVILLHVTEFEWTTVWFNI